MDILIFDDDPYLSEMVAAVAGDAGYSVEKSPDSVGALEKVRALKPRLVITDIMLPGVDGLTLCRQIKSAPDTKDVHVIVYSGRPYPDDARRAAAAGAAAYFSKDSLDFDGLVRAVRGLLGTGLGASPAPARAAAFRARVWGCAGAGSEPASNCVSVEFGGRVVVLDAGTGLSALAKTPAPADANLWLLMSQASPERLGGLPALAGWLSPGGSLRTAGPGDLSAVSAVFASSAADSPARRAGVAAIAEGRFQLYPDVVLETMWTRHPEMALAFALTSGGRRLIYCADNEPESPDDVQTDFTEKFGRFVRGADVLIHDCRWTDADRAARPNQGHASPKAVVDLAVKEGVRRVVLYNFDAAYGPDRLAELRGEAEALIAAGRWTVRVDLAEPGQLLDV